MLERENDLMSCGLSYAFYTIGGKWKPYILWYLHCSPDNTCRYGELKRYIPWTISHKMFAQQLRELERDGLVIRQEYEEQTLRVEYSLTDKGLHLIPVILYMRDWGVMFGDDFSKSTLKNTRGNWQGKQITYDSHPGDLERGTHIRFDVGITEEELTARESEHGDKDKK